MPRQPSDIWRHFNEVKKDGKVVKYICKYCSQQYVKNATKQQKHIERCPKAPSNVKSSKKTQGHALVNFVSPSSPGPSISSSTIESENSVEEASQATPVKRAKITSRYFDSMTESEQL